MQENTESEKPEDSEIPEEPETSSEVTSENDPPDSPDTDPAFEEHDGEVLPPEKKKSNGFGFFILTLILLTGGSGYLYYTDQIPPKIMQWVEPLIKKLNPPHEEVASPRPSQSWVSEVEEKNPTPAIPKEIPSPPKETVIEIVPPLSEEHEHISGSESEPVMEVIEPDLLANISGTTTEVKPEEEEPEEFKEEPVIEPVPIVAAPKPSAPVAVAAPESSSYAERPSQKIVEEPVQQKERSEAVQSYLDFFEATLATVGELIKTGFVKGKDFLMQFLKRN